MLWTPQSEDQATDVAASRISCIVIALVLMAVLAIAIYPSIASELVSLQCLRLHVHKFSYIRRGKPASLIGKDVLYGLSKVHA